MSLDCSKCFDTLDVSALCDLAISRGLLPGVFGAFCRLSLSHERVLAHKGWRGPSTVPKTGLAQGDGLSVVLAILWGWSLQKCVCVSGVSLCVLVYLDDISVSASTVTEVSRGFVAAATFLWSWGVCLNPSKSTISFLGQTDQIP
eukprot:4956302-Amphidinium_carterae.1